MVTEKKKVQAPRNSGNKSIVALLLLIVIINILNIGIQLFGSDRVDNSIQGQVTQQTESVVSMGIIDPPEKTNHSREAAP